MRKQPKKTNSTDIARLAGVSRSTVSRVINAYPNVPEATRAHVMQVIEQHGYYPSVSGKTLRGKCAHCLGAFIGEQGWRDEMQAALLLAFMQQAQALHYLTFSGKMCDIDLARCGAYIREVLCSGYVDAGVFFNATGGEPLVRSLLDEGHTLGVIGLPPMPDAENLFTVALDEQVVQEAMARIVREGFTSAAVLVEPRGSPGSDTLIQAFSAAATNMGVRLWYAADRRGLSLERQAELALQEQGTQPLLVCIDQTAVYAAYRAAALLGFTVGREVFILGMGLLPMFQPMWPPLTALYFLPEEMTASLVERMIAMLEGDTEVQRHSILQYKRMDGESFPVLDCHSKP